MCPIAADHDKVDDHLWGISRLNDGGLIGVGNVEAYYQCCVAPLMDRPLRMFLMGDRDDNEQM